MTIKTDLNTWEYEISFSFSNTEPSTKSDKSGVQNVPLERALQVNEIYVTIEIHRQE